MPLPLSSTDGDARCRWPSTVYSCIMDIVRWSTVRRGYSCIDRRPPRPGPASRESPRPRIQVAHCTFCSSLSLVRSPGRSRAVTASRAQTHMLARGGATARDPLAAPPRVDRRPTVRASLVAPGGRALSLSRVAVGRACSIHRAGARVPTSSPRLRPSCLVRRRRRHVARGGGARAPSSRARLSRSAGSRARCSSCRCSGCCHTRSRSRRAR